MKKLLILLSLSSILMTSCTLFNKEDKSDKKQPVVEEVTPSEEEYPEEEDDTLIVPEYIEDFLVKKMPGFSIVPREQWLAEDYIEQLKGTPYEPSYKNDILIEGDFNGDGEMDFATFLVDKSGNIYTYSFHKRGDTYKKYVLQREGKPEYLGAGLMLEEPGLSPDGNKEVGLDYNAVTYMIYEKTDKTFYYDGKRYRSMIVND